MVHSQISWGLFRKAATTVEVIEELPKLYLMKVTHHLYGHFKTPFSNNWTTFSMRMYIMQLAPGCLLSPEKHGRSENSWFFHPSFKNCNFILSNKKRQGPVNEKRFYPFNFHSLLEKLEAVCYAWPQNSHLKLLGFGKILHFDCLGCDSCIGHNQTKIILRPKNIYRRVRCTKYDGSKGLLIWIYWITFTRTATKVSHISLNAN